MPHFGEQPPAPANETPEQKADRLAGDLELAPLEDSSFTVDSAEAGAATSQEDTRISEGKN